jgi:hypothetical protein
VLKVVFDRMLTSQGHFLQVSDRRLGRRTGDAVSLAESVERLRRI